jgi:probable 2-oxoglutarate dehydrogenase E1 component DHKTD1
LPHYTVGGSIHIIVNNQIGYTTPGWNSRSSLYTSDIGKMISCPIIHVNADFPEDVAYATSIACEYRNKFRKDVIIDLIAYRRLGHNELDEPAFTQPLMYKNIRSRKSVPTVYEEQLKKEGVIKSASIVQNIRAEYEKELEDALTRSATYEPKETPLKGTWEKMVKPLATENEVDTGIN